MKHKGGRPVELPEKIEITRLFLKNGYSVKEIAKMAHRSERTVKWWIKEGKLSTDPLAMQ